MTILMTLLGFLAWGGEVPVACNLKAISEADRPRHADLGKRLRESVVSKRSVRGGYEMELDGSRIGIAETAEWIAMERLCCPFLRFQLATGIAGARWTLQVVGPRSAKPILDAAFRAQ
ncbi:MAG: hypothetical protein K2X35_07795 [Bryobacteraceae bacterium]|nr:hypothetical protein [Bryobacteraceae bacterium]